MDKYGGRSHIYILQLHIWLIFCFTGNITKDKMNNMMWVRMVGEFIYIFYNYVFCLYIIFFDRVDEARKMRIQIWMRMAEMSYIYIYITVTYLAYIFSFNVLVIHFL